MRGVCLFAVAALLSSCLRGGFDPIEGTTADSTPDAPPVVDGPPSDASNGVAISGGADDPTWTGVALSSSEVSREQQSIRLLELKGFELKKGGLPSARGWGSAIAHGGGIYLFGGGFDKDGDFAKLSTEVLRYDIRSDTVAKVAVLPYPIIASQAVLAPEEKIFVIEGVDPVKDHVHEQSILLFDPKDGATSVVRSDLDGRYYHAAAAAGGVIYIFGGFGCGPLYDSIEAYDPAEDRLVTVSATLPSPRDKLSAFTAPNGMIYLFGGSLSHSNVPYQGTPVSDQILRFDPKDSAIKEVAKLPTPLMNAAGGLLADGKIYIVGGDTGDSSDINIDAVYRFDPEQETLETLPDKLPFAVSGAAAAVADNGKLYLLGGMQSNVLGAKVVEYRPYAKTGEALGPVIDTGVAGTPWQSLEWQAKVPEGTTVVVTVRASEEPFGSSPPPWRGYDPAKDDDTLPSGRYQQWRVSLGTSNTGVTPELIAVTSRYGAKP